MNPITILLAEDHDAVREGLKSLLKLEADIKIVGEAQNGRQAVAFASKLCPDVVVMDISMPLLNGLEATLQIRQHVPSTKVLVLSSHVEPAYVERAKALGASGFVTKNSAAKVLPLAIRQVHKGEAFFTPNQATSTESL
jgi:DNA-binding NarL/FixJ family response regulator